MYCYYPYIVNHYVNHILISLSYIFSASREAITEREDEADDQQFGYSDAGKKFRTCNSILV